MGSQVCVCLYTTLLTPSLLNPLTCSQDLFLSLTATDNYKQLYANKMDNLEEMDKFIEMLNLPRLNQEEIENMNRPITSTEIEIVIKNLPAIKAKDQMAS